MREPGPAALAWNKSFGEFRVPPCSKPIHSRLCVSRMLNSIVAEKCESLPHYHWGAANIHGSGYGGFLWHFFLLRECCYISKCGVRIATSRDICLNSRVGESGGLLCLCHFLFLGESCYVSPSGVKILLSGHLPQFVCKRIQRAAVSLPFLAFGEGCYAFHQRVSLFSPRDICLSEVALRTRGRLPSNPGTKVERIDCRQSPISRSTGLPH